MSSELSDRRLHLWARAVPPEMRPQRGYAVCGIHIGRFVSKLEEVTCTDCLNIIATKESNAAQAAG